MRFTMVIQREEDDYVAHCLELDIASQGATVGEARGNLTEAVQAFLESAEPQEVRHRLAAELYVESMEVSGTSSQGTSAPTPLPPNQLGDTINNLINQWCERRALGPLSAILCVWPMPNGFTDEWHALRDALRHIRAGHGKSLPREELSSINGAISLVDQALFGKL